MYFFLTLFQCVPYHKLFDVYTARTQGCLSMMEYFVSTYVVAGLNAVSDLAFAVLPMCIIYRTTMDRRTKVSVCILLALGSL